MHSHLIDVEEEVRKIHVLILVVMEDALAQNSNSKIRHTVNMS